MKYLNVCILIVILYSGATGFAVTTSTQSSRQLLTKCKLPSVLQVTKDDVISAPGSDKTRTNEQSVDLPVVTNLDAAISSFNSSAATAILSTLTRLREQNDPIAIEQYVNRLLAGGPDGKLPFWSSFRPLARFSKRARLASLRRTLDSTTPPDTSSSADDVDENKQQQQPLDLEDRQRRRRRAFVALLRALVSDEEVEGRNKKTPAIVVLERQAKRAKGSSKENLILRRPKELETPEYVVIIQRGDFEIRQYKPYAVCSVSMKEPRPIDSERTDAKLTEAKMGGATAFGALAGYLFGKNQQKTAMKMTTPVLTTGQGDAKQMSFVLPSTYWKENGLSIAPKPLDGSGVILQRTTEETKAVVMFGGYATKQEVAKMKAKLMNSVSKDKEWEAITEPIVLAQYNDPFTPPWKRLNEISINVQRKQ